MKSMFQDVVEQMNTHKFDMTLVRKFLKRRASISPTGIYEHHDICNRDKKKEVPHCKYCQINFVMTLLGEYPRVIALFEGHYKYKNSGKRFFSYILVGEEIFPRSYKRKIQITFSEFFT